MKTTLVGHGQIELELEVKTEEDRASPFGIGSLYTSQELGISISVRMDSGKCFKTTGTVLPIQMNNGQIGWYTTDNFNIGQETEVNTYNLKKVLDYINKEKEGNLCDTMYSVMAVAKTRFGRNIRNTWIVASYWMKEAAEQHREMCQKSLETPYQRDFPSDLDPQRTWEHNDVVYSVVEVPVRRHVDEFLEKQ